jgi:multidrug efflux pump subunit AcrA (membrane-fusion protein)
MARLLHAIGFLMILALGPASSPVASAESRKAKSIEAAGTLEPSYSSLVYPCIDGVLKAWHCKSGEQVRKGQKIATVTSADMERRLGQLRSEIQASKDKIAGLEKMTKNNQKVRVELVKEQARLKLKAKQLHDLNRTYQGGDIASPNDGTVIIANPKKLLGRSVMPSEPICRVVRLKGEWHARVWFAERDVGLLLQFLRAAKDKRAAVELVAAAFPGKTFKGTLCLRDVAEEMTLREKKSVLYARIRIDKESLKVLRILPVGANVRIKISVAKGK